jgi:nitrate/nitrite transport system ATP-binding protein
MMTNGSAARIGDVLEVALPRPRNRLELATNPHYSAYRQYLLKFLYQKQGVSLE